MSMVNHKLTSFNKTSTVYKVLAAIKKPQNILPKGVVYHARYCRQLFFSVNHSRLIGCFQAKSHLERGAGVCVSPRRIKGGEITTGTRHVAVESRPLRIKYPLSGLGVQKFIGTGMLHWLAPNCIPVSPLVLLVSIIKNFINFTPLNSLKFSYGGFKHVR